MSDQRKRAQRAALSAGGLCLGGPVLGTPRLRTAKPESVRKRRFRQLQHAGGAAPSVPCGDINAVIELLIDLRWLDEKHSEDRRQVGVAAGRLLDELAGWATGMRDKLGPTWTHVVEFPGSNPAHEQ